MIEQILINILGNSPTLIAVLIIYARFDKRCALIEKDINELWREEKKCWLKS